MEVSTELRADLERLTVGEEPSDGSVSMTDHDGGIDGEADVSDDPGQSDPSEIDLAELMTAATAASTDSRRAETRTALTRELALIDEMREIAEASRYDADPRVRRIVDWIDANMCPVQSVPRAVPPQWNDRRLLIFTEYEDTRRWLERCLNEAIMHSDQARERIATFTERPPGTGGKTSSTLSTPSRATIRCAFLSRPTRRGRASISNATVMTCSLRPALEPEPSRSAQRPHRPQAPAAGEVFCRYFVFVQRPEDRSCGCW